MKRIVALADVTDTREQLGTPGQEIWRTWLLKPVVGTRLPQAFFVEYAPGRVLRTHFHDVDEFQVVVAGGGTFGSHDVAPLMVHFARAYTPYGPIVAGPSGLSFLTLRAQRDSSGPQKLPEMREALEKVRNRRPFQVAQLAQLDESADSVAVRPMDRFSGGGLAAYSMGLPKDTVARVSVSENSGGHFVAVVAGSITIESRILRSPAIVYLLPKSQPLRVRSVFGAAQLLVLSFPEIVSRDEAIGGEEAAPPASTPPDGQWACGLCGFTYHETAGQPSRGIAPGTAWDDLPEAWRCDDCDAPKDDFVRVDPLSAK